MLVHLPESCNHPANLSRVNTPVISVC
jgi:hypothetical protein